MKICNRCLYSEVHPLNITFDDEGVCSGCRVHEEKDILNWGERGDKLKSLLASYKNQSGNNYDCIIPVSGARDSYFIVHTVKKVYGMNPLLVTYNKQYNTDTGIRNLAYLKTLLDCDMMMLTVNPNTVKKITRATMRKFGSIYWHCIAGQTAYPVQMAVKLKIPLIVWGAHQGVDQVGMFSHLNEVEMTRKYRKEHDLMGVEAEDLIDEADNITSNDIIQYIYPDDKEIERIGVRGIYLNNYIRWDSRSQHEEMIKLYNYETRAQSRTFDSYNDVDCFNYSDTHDYIKYLKHGYGKVTDHASREIRLRRLTREQGVELVKRYEQEPPQNFNLFLDWLGITENTFHYILDQHRNKNFWRRNELWEWELYNSPLYGDVDVKPDELSQIGPYKEFVISPERVSSDKKGEYILIGKGHS